MKLEEKYMRSQIRRNSQAEAPLTVVKIIVLICAIALACALLGRIG